MAFERARQDIEAVIGEISDELWEYLIRKHYVSEYVDGSMSAEDVAQEVRDIRQATGRRSGVRPTAPKMLTEKRGRATTSALEVRQTVIAQIVASYAAKQIDVKHFRDKALGGVLLQWAEVANWIDRQRQSDGEPTNWVDAPLPPGVDLGHLEDAILGRADHIPVRFPGAASALEHGYGYRYLLYGVPDHDRRRSVAVTVGGTLDWLRIISQRLGHRFAWEPAQATVFVLTGLPPAVEPYRAEATVIYSFPVLSRIKITVDPALSSHELRRQYSEVRQWMIGERFRPQTEKHLRLALVAAERDDEETWEDAWRKWNAEADNSDWTYDSEEHFARDAREALKRLLNPGFPE